MSLNLFRRLDRYDRRIRQLERTEPEEGGGGGGGDHADSDHADAFSALSHAHSGTYAPVEHDTTHDDRFSLLAHTHAVHADSDHDDRFSLLAHSHGAPGAHTHDWVDVTGEPATFPPTPQALDWLTDVATAGAATDDVLGYFPGFGWGPKPVADITGALSIDDLNDVEITGTPTDDQILEYDGTAMIWRNQNRTGGWLTVSTFNTGWMASSTAGDQAPRYRLEGDLVRLDGVARQNSGTNALAFTLASGYRPTSLKRFYVAGGANTQARWAIGTDGGVSATAGSDLTRVALEGLTFPIT